MKKKMKMTEMWGRKCREFDSGCRRCIAWAIYCREKRIPSWDDVTRQMDVSHPRTS